MSLPARTRSESSDLFCGDAKPLNTQKLPTIEDVLQACTWERKSRKSSAKEPPWNEIKSDISSIVYEIWQNSSIPTVSLKRIGDMIQKYHDQHRGIWRSFKRDQHKPVFKNKCDKFLGDVKLLFDCAACKCVVDACRCPLEKKVPKEEAKFLHDQRHGRKMFIGDVDKKNTSHKTKLYSRKARKMELESSTKQSTSGCSSNALQKKIPDEASI